MESYLARGNPLIIDDESMWKYPFHTNTELYNRYGSRARNIVFNKVYELDIDDVINFFPHIRELTLRNMAVIYYEKPAKWPITTLRLINFIDIEEFLACALSDDLIETLVIERSTPCWLVYMPVLQSLTLIDQQHYTALQYFPNLRQLTIDQWPGDELAQLEHLERLKIRQSVDPKHREAIEAMNLTSVEIYYFDVPTEETPILRLNEYCLLHIISYLSTEDWAAFRATHRHFRGLKIAELVLDKETLRRHPMPQHNRFYEHIGSFVPRLVVDNIKSEDVCRMLPLFVNLQELTLKGANIGEGGIIDLIPSGLRKLHLDSKQDLNMSDSDLFDRLSSTLQVLELNFEEPSTGSTIQLSMLQIIRKFKCVNLQGTEDFLLFLMLNSGHMRHLDVCLSTPSALETEMWRIIAQMYPLDNLTISNNESSFKVPDIPNGSLPNLKSLSLCGRNIWKYVEALDGSELETMALNTWNVPREEDFSRFPKLKKLKLFAFFSDILSLIKAHPELKELRLSPYGEDEVIRDVTRYLKETNRNLLFEYHDGILIYTNAK